MIEAIGSIELNKNVRNRIYECVLHAPQPTRAYQRSPRRMEKLPNGVERWLCRLLDKFDSVVFWTSAVGKSKVKCSKSTSYVFEDGDRKFK